MTKIFTAIFFVILVLSHADGQAVLTLDRCLTLAREHSPRLRTAENAIRAADLSQSELSTGKLPQVRLSASSIYSPSSGSFAYDPALADGGRLAGQVVVQQSLYDGGMRGLKSEQLSLDHERFTKERRMTERDLLFSVKQAFYETLRSGREIGLETESVSQLSEYLDIVRRLSKGGNAAYTDVLKTELQLSNAQLAFQKAKEAFALAKYSLAELISLTADTSFTLEGSLEDTVTSEMKSPSSDMPSDSAETLELSIASLVIKHSGLDVEMTRHENYPIISFIGDLGLLTSGDNLRLPSDARSGIFGYSFGVEVEFPLINWGATDLRVQQKQIETDNAHLQSELLRRSLASESGRTRVQLMKQRERLKTLHANRKLAEDNFYLTQSKYTGGGTLSLEVLSAQQLLTDSKLSELQTLADIQFLTAKLEQLIAH